MIYIDFDDVIVNTSEVMVKMRSNDKNAPVKYFNDPNFIINLDWSEFLKKVSVLKNAINIIKSFNPNEITILTKVHSLDNEGAAKIHFLRDNGVKCNIMLVPVNGNKSDVVYMKDAILVDDQLHNLEEWENNGGKGIFFDRFGVNADGWGNPNTKYDKIESLDELSKY